ncbi:MAG: hypothetical protein WCR19_05960, partial [Acholeplasmataceae bacterium]
MITTDNNTNTYTLMTDLDFNNVTPSTWTDTKDITFKGTFYGGSRTVSNIDLTDYRGIFGVLDSAIIQDLILENVNIDYTSTSLYTTGILAGRLQGTNNFIENITIRNSSITNDNVLAGGLIGFASPASGTGSAVIKNINIENTIVSGGYSNSSYGNGGLISTVNNFDLTLEDINIEADVTSTTNSNVGGIIGSLLGSTVVSIDGANINNSNLTIQGSGTTLGAGGAIGYMINSGHSLSNINISDTTISSASQSGGLIGYANSSSSTLDLDFIDVSNTTISSSISDVSSGAGGIFGVLNGYTVDMTNIDVSANITSSSNANAGGLAAVVTSTSVINLNESNIEDTEITINGTGTTLGAGGAIGLLNGTNHTFENVDVSNTTITSASQSGGLIGYANSSSSSVSLDTINIADSTVTSSISNTSSGAGGVFGVINGYTVTAINSNISANVTASSNANAGGFTAYVTSTSTLNLETIIIEQSTILISGTTTTLGAGGFIGLLNGSSHTFTDIEVIDTNVTSVALSGGVIGYANQTSGTLTINGIDVQGSTISSSLSNIAAGVGGVIASLNGYTLNLSNAYISSDITMTGDSSAGGIIGYVSSTGIMNFNTITVDQTIITSSGSNSSVGAGGLIGLLLGSSHQLSYIRVLDSSISNQSNSGGIIGRSEQKTSTVTISNVSVTGSTIYSNSTSGTEGAGGIVGRTRYHTYIISDVYIESDITANRSNAAGIVGFARYVNLTVSRAVVYSNLIVSNAGTTTNRGAAGIIGRNRDSSGSSITDFFFTGYLQARVSGSTTYVGILKVIDDDLTYTNVRSAEITYYLSSNANTLVTSSTLYSQMLGQNPTYTSTYTQLRSNLTASYWTTN